MTSERQHEDEIAQGSAITTPNDNTTQAETAKLEETAPGAFQRFRSLLDQVRRTQQPLSRRELSRDKSKSLLLLIGVSVALLLVFFGVFSSPRKQAILSDGTVHGIPNLGREVTPGQEPNDPAKSVTPLLSADVRDADSAPASEVTPEDVGGTSPGYSRFRQPPVPNAPGASKPAPGKVRSQERYALKNIDFSDPVLTPSPTPTIPTVRSEPGPDLKEPSIVFVRATQTINPAVQSSPKEENAFMDFLPTGTRLVARLEAPISSAVPTPVIAVVEYSYERNGEIILPAGTKVFGKVSHVSPAGFVGLEFDHAQLPDGTEERIDAMAMDLRFGPLKGIVTGRNRGRNFLIRSMTGIGTVAAYVVGGQGTTGFNGPISENSLMRERLAENIGTAGQEEINSLAVNQTIVVTVPGNTRFYIVVEKANSDSRLLKSTAGSVQMSTSSSSPAKVPTLEELRQLIQLRNELNQMYSQINTQAPAQ